MYNFLHGRLRFVRLCLLVSTLALVIIGIITIYTVGNPAESSPANQTGELVNLWKKQLIFAVLGILAFFAVNLTNYRRLGSWSFSIYVLILLLLGTLLLGRYIIHIPFIPEINGSYRWITLTIAGHQLPAIQPSELCKLGYVLALAWYLRYRSNYRNFSALIGPFLLTLLPMVMILLEPDLGTVMLMMPILFTMLFVAGAKVKHLAIIALCAVLVSPLLWFRMNPYQQRRISCVLLQSNWLRHEAEEHPGLGKILVGSKFNTQQWKKDWGYHLIRSKLAIASGGLTGYGFGKGPFVKFNFLPYRYNDFIFAVFAHQWGFLGCISLFMLYLVIIVCGLEIAANNTDPFGRLLAIGIIAVFAVEVLINVSMTIGLMPITGLTLPLVSYGGSSLLVSMMFIGLLNNVGRCRPFTVARKT
jgi:rod shape determining protein RodA